MLYIAYFIIVSGHNIKKNSEIFPFLTCRGLSLCTHQMPLNHLQTAISKLSGAHGSG